MRNRRRWAKGKARNRDVKEKRERRERKSRSEPEQREQIGGRAHRKEKLESRAKGVMEMCETRP